MFCLRGKCLTSANFFSSGLKLEPERPLEMMCALCTALKTGYGFLPDFGQTLFASVKF